MNAQAQDIAEGELISVESSVNQALMQITKGEIDQQIATAHMYPRSIAKFQKRALEMVTLDEETAASCLYSRPVGKDPQTGKQKFAEGMSVRMAEIVGACYGNLRVGSMMVEMTPRYVKARGFAHDLETNFASTSEVVESTVDKGGRPFSERMRVVVAKAALSKARRDGTFTVVPKALCKSLEAAARQTAIGDATTLAKRRNAVMQWVSKLGIDPARVFAALSVTGEADLGLDELTTLTGIKTAIKDGDTTIDEAFPSLDETTERPKSRAEAAKDALRGGKSDDKPPEDKKHSSSAASATKGGDPKATPSEKSQDLGGYVPHHDEKSALAAIRGASTEKALDELKADVLADYSKSGRPLPDSIEPAISDRREYLKQQEQKL